MTAAELANWVVGATGTLLGAGGITAFFKARGENRASLSDSESKFRESILAQLAAAQGKIEQQQDNLNEQVRAGARRDAEIAAMANVIDRVQTIILERDMAIRDRNRAVKLLEECERKAEVDRQAYSARIAELEGRVADLTKQVEELTKHTKEGTHDQAAT